MRNRFHSKSLGFLSFMQQLGARLTAGVPITARHESISTGDPSISTQLVPISAHVLPILTAAVAISAATLSILHQLVACTIRHCDRERRHVEDRQEPVLHRRTYCFFFGAGGGVVGFEEERS